MFIGHYAAALAAKRLAPKTSLGTLVFGAQFLDLLWPLLLLLNVEHFRIAPGDTRFTPLDFYDYPISHSLLAVIGWAAVVGLIYFGLNRGFRRSHEDSARAAWVMAALVMSHWVLDAVVHRPDLPLRPGGTTLVGLGLWNSVAGTLVLETLLYGAAVVVYLRGTAADGKRRVTFWVFIFVIYAFYAASAFGPPPPTVGAVAWAGMGQWLFVLWAWWVDRPSRGATGVEASALSTIEIQGNIMRVVTVSVGVPREVLWNGRVVTTGIFKEAVKGPVTLRRHNLDGDQQADLTVHGGPNKAVYAYPLEHYGYWAERLPGRDLPMGSFGENLTTEGLLESAVCVGDRFRIGTAEVVVTQPRMPCYKLGIKFESDAMIKLFLESRRSGFYLAVLSEGEVGAGDSIERLSHEPDAVCISEVVRLYLAKTYGEAETSSVRRLLQTPALPESWKEYFLEKLERAEG